MKNKTIRIAALAALLLIALAAALALLLGGAGEQPIEAGNLLENGDFAAVTGGMPDGWVTGMWVTSAGASYLEAATTEDGTSAALIENVAANDARFEQTVAVRENSTYRLSARVMAEGCDEGAMGANVSFLGIYGASEDVHDTAGQWETVELYAQTGKGQREVTVCVRVGGYGSEATGKAYFTDVVLEQVEAAPIGASVLDLSTPEPQKQTATDGEGGHQGMVIPALIAAGVVYLALAALVVQTALRGGSVPRGRSVLCGGSVPRWALGALLVAAALMRLALAFAVEGYGVDMGCFSAWALKMASGGPANFYEAGYFCDYPPAYMLVLGAMGALANALGVAYGGMGMQALLKLAPIACDIALAAMVYGLTARLVSRRAGLGLAALMAFNPAFVVTGACWGQIDAVLSVLLVLMLVQAKAGRWQAAIPIFALAVLTKPQAGLLAPLGVAALVKDIADKGTRKENGKRIGLGLLLGVAVTALIVIPFSIKQDNPLWLVERYADALSSYDFATLSTGNLMFLLGGNWVQNSEVLLFGVTYGRLGMALMALSFAAGIALYLTGRGRSRLMLSAAMTMQLVFVLGSKMHERYILPALALLLLAYLETGDARVLLSAVLASVATAVNVGVVLAFEYLIAPNLWLGYALSVVQLAAAGLTVWAAVDAVRGREPKRLPARMERKAEQDGGAMGERQPCAELTGKPLDHRMHMTRRDWALMLGITAAYAVVGFWHLGATKAPQTGYSSTQAGESVVFDLGEQRENFHIYYYGGISNVTFTFATSEDGVSYTEEQLAYFEDGTCFKWQAMRSTTRGEDGALSASGGMLGFSGRYIRVTFESAGASLWEVAAVDESGTPYPIAVASAQGAREGRGDDAAKLIDEQDTVPDVPSYYNSMYFDEIYHARTGYEHAHSLNTYEWTHPPLGKVFMSWCIRLMGMTPFAWRFAGTLVGVLMLPAMYLLAMQLFKHTKFAAFATLLLALDCMHFTQTRIATIDSFPVLFMMLMFLCMARWMQMNFLTQRLRDTLVPLALSGFFMALAIASKWIGCYGAVGLALLFFARFIALARQAAYAKRHAGESPAYAHAAAVFPRHAALTLIWCVVFFVIVPVVVYGLSYIPYLSAYGPVKLNLTSIKRVWDLQLSMWSYHTDLNATHFFASPWYEWPVIAKPMWYYNADYKGAGMASSILAFGNPAVWWTGLVAIVFVLLYSAYRNAAPCLGLRPRSRDALDRAMPVIAVGFLSAYLPWVLVARLTFIYHYFASVPFIILATAQAARYAHRRWPRATSAGMAALVVIALMLFIGFYPLMSGMEVPRAWCDVMNWFDGWMWY